MEYVIVGGYAMAFHGYPRFTKDIDIFIRNSVENIGRVRKSLIAFGFGEDALDESLFSEQGNIVQFGIVPLRVDIINEIDGVGFDEAMKNSVRGKYGDIEVNFIGRIELIKNKRASGREQDALDAKKLEKNNHAI
ncbi:MAG: hypothetical protein JW768_03810 [Chitinispirillaceae bacterium]|nr:hypothetical protein [Chitinispirillaceae bacterium]